HDCEAIAVHAYPNGQPFDDPDWGGRPLEYAARFPGQPLLVTECNDNGAGPRDEPFTRGAGLGAYLGWLESALGEAVELTCLFQLPGGPSAEPWWDLSTTMVEGFLAGLELARSASGGVIEGSTMPEYLFGNKTLAETLGHEVVGGPMSDQQYIGSEWSFQMT